MVQRRKSGYETPQVQIWDCTEDVVVMSVGVVDPNDPSLDTGNDTIDW